MEKNKQIKQQKKNKKAKFLPDTANFALQGFKPLQNNREGKGEMKTKY